MKTLVFSKRLLKAGIKFIVNACSVKSQYRHLFFPLFINFLLHCTVIVFVIKSKERLTRLPVFSKILFHGFPWDQFHIQEASLVSCLKISSLKEELPKFLGKIYIEFRLGK